ncbi:hypothetical protein DY000_02047320 [Brassica cretica]|uniref:Uncharacterized protein n=1 Tax=Brassica cretica TaxID=69181 RepID=A0ABQ7EUN1_BRACR|nr:hypothetical protein DY000_02047320 [Brassica cretica]
MTRYCAGYITLTDRQDLTPPRTAQGQFFFLLTTCIYYQPLLEQRCFWGYLDGKEAKKICSHNLLTARRRKWTTVRKVPLACPDNIINLDLRNPIAGELDSTIPWELGHNFS